MDNNYSKQFKAIINRLNKHKDDNSDIKEIINTHIDAARLLSNKFCIDDSDPIKAKGIYAYKSGENIEDNPYSEDQIEFVYWVCGWFCASGNDLE